MYLGIDNQSGLIYEGLGGPDMPVVPTPNVTQAKLIENPEDWASLPSGIFQSPMAWIFREDSFDPVTRTRRGRLYFSPEAQAQPSAHRVVPHPYEDPFGSSAGQGGRQAKSLFTYTACTSLLSEANQGLGLTIALGSPQAASAWRIIQTEVLANGCVMVTLKSLTVFGIVPMLDSSKIDHEFQQSISQAIDRVLDSAFKESPISVIDHCRNAIAVVLSRWLVQKGCDRSILSDDLGRIAGIVAKDPYAIACSSWLAQVVARLHVRGKGNEQHSRSLRAPVEEDAEIAIQALGFVIRDIDWALLPG
jgi:hypothetical protein